MASTVIAPAWVVQTLGEARILSPLGLSKVANDQIPEYTRDGMRVLHGAEIAPGEIPDPSRSFEMAGPREHLFFDPMKTRAGILTAGGLCPGTNNVIRSLVLHLVHKYGVASVTGFRYGFAGLDPATGIAPVALTTDDVRHIHARGGTMLGTSRGAHEASVMVDTLVAHHIHCLFTIGGDGTMRAAHSIAVEATRRGLALSVVAIPKTIDNDVPFADKTFGFETAVSMAKVAIDAAHTEASSALNGLGLVKLMGRNAGFIAAHAALASHDVNVCLVPEVDFELEGPNGLFEYLGRRVRARGHAVIVVAEGCGVRLARQKEAGPPDSSHDASGNLRFASSELDIGSYLRGTIGSYFVRVGLPVTLKYIDPSYMLRGVPANATDAVFCDDLARYAAHASMAGKTDVMVGRWNRAFTHVPLPLVLSEKKRIDPHKDLWLAVTETTGQPRFVA